jgi:CheY-like chemotaxis protein
MNSPDRQVKRRILVVDDESVIQALVYRVLTAGGRELVIAGSTKEGLSRINSQVFDLLLTDLRLPDGHGEEVMRRFRVKFPHAPIIVLTGSLTPEDHFATVADLGDFKCIIKPFDLEILQKAVNQALGGG